MDRPGGSPSKIKNLRQSHEVIDNFSNYLGKFLTTNSQFLYFQFLIWTANYLKNVSEELIKT